MSGAAARFDARYRRTGANIPRGDPRPSHGAEMEGYFWRLTDVDARRVLVVLCGVNRAADGHWATVAIAAHPGGFVRSAVVPWAEAARDRFHVAAGDGMFLASDTRVAVDLGPDARAEFEIAHPVGWPLALGGGGVFSAVPFLGQYWHPHLLSGEASGAAVVAGEAWHIDGADVYAEKNWGAGFPERWWWGQAQGFDRRDVCVAFSGGALTAGPLSATVGGIIVRVGAHVLRVTPPFARVRSHVAGGRWEIDGRRWGTRVRIVGEAIGAAHVPTGARAPGAEKCGHGFRAPRQPSHGGRRGTRRLPRRERTRRSRGRPPA